MKLGICYRFANDPEGKRTRLYIPIEFKEMFDDFNISLIPIVSDINVEEIVDFCDGLIVPGSYADTNPKYYNEKPLDNKTYDVDEYAFDSKIVTLFNKAQKPIIGICGGLQEVNVLFGGTLNQYIDNHSGINHKVKINTNSFLYEVYQKDEIEVNSLHHQSIKDVAPGFIVSAISNDNVVEAIEKENIICVQWHPEILKDKAFFKKFIDKYLM